MMRALMRPTKEETMKSPRGATVWRGPSQIDGTPIVCILTGLQASGSGNAKTGAMVQAWILVDGMKPIDAWRAGKDAGICGECPHRGWKGSERTKRSCYVSFATGLAVVGKQALAGMYPDVDPSTLGDVLRGRVLRMGAYGDPAAVPLRVWQTLAGMVDGWTGYTHQWRELKHAGLAGYVMASADSFADRENAVAAGWRTFRVTRDTLPPLALWDLVSGIP